MVKGLFGFFTGKQEEEVQEKEEKAYEVEEVTEEDAYMAKDFLQNLLDEMGFVSVVKIQKREKSELCLEIKSEDVGRIIGKEGSTLNALQFLMKNIIQKKSKKRVTVILDANQYRERRAQSLETKAMRAAKKALRNNVEVKMGPMPAYERRIVHLILEDSKDVYTFSRGERDHRQVVVAPKKNPE